MSRHIDAEPFVAYLARTVNHLHEMFGDCTVAKTLEIVIKQISETPSADVVPVIHAHWIVKPTIGLSNKYECHCSACGNGYEADSVYDPIDLNQTEWCLWCGAKMDEEN